MKTITKDPQKWLEQRATRVTKIMHKLLYTCKLYKYSSVHLLHWVAIKKEAIHADGTQCACHHVLEM